MSESAVILEGEVARRFNPVDKLRATNQDSSVSDWVPADTLDLGSLMASENTLYLANIDDDCDAYEEVEVDVSEELEDGDYKKITGKGNDGNDYAVGLDENGNLTSEMVPSAIHIVIKPRKLEYKEGETLDFTGIHVYLMDGNNQRFTSEDYPTGEIPFEELLLPVTIAENGDGGEYSDGDGCNVLKISYEKGDNGTVGYFSSLGQHSDSGYGPWGASLGSYSDSSIGKPFYITRYNNELYAIAINNDVIRIDLIANLTPPNPWGNRIGWCVVGTTANTVINSWNRASWNEQLTEIPVSTKLSDINKLHPTSGGIPVQWMRSDGEMLEDSFSISITKDNNESEHNGTSDSGSGHTSGGF